MRYDELSPIAQKRALALVKMYLLSSTEPENFSTPNNSELRDLMEAWASWHDLVINDDDVALDTVDSYDFDEAGWIVSGEIEKLLNPFWPSR